MRQLALAFLLLPFLYLSQASAAECGFKSDNKTVDPNSSTLCPENIAMKLMSSSVGEGVLLLSNDQDAQYAKIQETKTDSQLRFDEANQDHFIRDKQYTRDLASYLIIAIFIIIWLIMALKAWKTGEFHDSKNDHGEQVKARYSFLNNLFLAIAAVGIIGLGMVGQKNSLSIADAVIIRLDVTSEIEKQKFIQMVSWVRQKGYLETTVKDSETGVVDDVTKGQAAFTASALSNQLISKALVARLSSQLYNDIFNKSDSSNWVVSNSLSDISKQENNTFTFKKFSEKGELLFKLDPVTVFKSELDAGAATPYLKEVRYNERFRDEADISTVEATANQLRNELRNGPFANKKAEYEDIKNNVMVMFYKDTRANTYLKELPNDFKLADDVAVTVLNLVCAENKQLRLSAKTYIDAHKGIGARGTGSIECVGNDWQVMGEDPIATYKTKLYETRKKLEDTYRDRILAFNDAFSTALESPSILDQLKKMIKEGELNFYFNYQNLVEETTFTSINQNLFNTKVLQISERKAVDFFIDDEWARAHGYEADYNTRVNISQYVRNYFLKTDRATLPAITDAETITQKLIFDNGTSAGMHNDFEQGAGIGFELPSTALKRCKLSVTHPIKCYQLYATSLSNTASDLRAFGLTLAITGQIANDYAKSKIEMPKTDSAANIGKPNKIQAGSSLAQTVTFIAAGIGSSIVSLSLTLDMISNGYRFLLISVTILPFYTMAVTQKYFVIALIKFSPFFLFAFVRLNDADNFAAMRRNIFAFAVSIAVFPILPLIAYTINWELIRVVLVFTDASFYYERGGIFDNIVGFFIECIRPFIVTLVSTSICLHFMQNTLKLLGGHMMFAEAGIKVIGWMMTIVNVLSIGSIGMINKLSTGFISSLTSYKRR